MKYVLLAIFVLFAAQPYQASPCDMHESGGSSHDGHNMQDNAMADSDGESMGCCDHDPSVPSDSCDPMSHCSAGSAAMLAITPATVSVTFSLDSRLYLADTGEPSSRFSSPPFRPPIA